MSSVTPSAEPNSSPMLSAQEALRLVELADIAVKTRSLEELAEWMLPPIAEMMDSRTTLLYVADPRLSAPFFHAQNVTPLAISEVESLCAQRFEVLASQRTPQPAAISILDLMLYPLQANGVCNSLLGLTGWGRPTSLQSEALTRLSSLLANTIDSLVERAESDKQIAYDP